MSTPSGSTGAPPRPAACSSTDCLLEQSVEEQAAGLGGAPVEPEGVLIEVVVQVVLGGGVVQGAGEPAFQQRGDHVDTGEEDVGRQRRGQADEVFVLVAP